MARNRTLAPGFWTSEQVVSVKPVVRLLFLGMISHADDDGRLKGDPTSLRLSVFPNDRIKNEAVLAMRDELACKAIGLIKVYHDTDGTDLIWIPTWHKHQKMSKYFPSKLPPHPEDTGRGKAKKAIANDAI